MSQVLEKEIERIAVRAAEGTVQQVIEPFRLEVKGRLDTVEKRLGTLETAIHDLTNEVKNLTREVREVKEAVSPLNPYSAAASQSSQ